MGGIPPQSALWENPKVKILHTNLNLGEIQNFYGKADNSAFAV